jgi:AcrR family transcriptional regulator
MTRDPTLRSDGSQRPARARLVEAATQLFYGEGIHGTGVDRIVRDAGVTKATFYAHFPSKDELVRAYMEEAHRGDVTMVETTTTRHGDDPAEALLALFDVAVDRARDASYRGCPYINAAAEYPDPTHPVRVVIAQHRAWLHDRFAGLLSAAGHPEPENTAHMLVLLWDGVGVGGYLDDPQTIQPAVRHAARTLIASPEAPAGKLGRA